MKLKHVFFLLSFSLCLSIFCAQQACTISLLPKYSQTIVDQVTAAAKKTDSLYSAIEAASNKNFATYVPAYSSIDASISSILLQDVVRNKPTLILSQAQSISDMFLKYENEHKNKVNITSGEARSYRNSMAALWQALLISETKLNK